MAAIRVEIAWLKPFFECVAHGRPALIGDGVPGGVAVAPLVDDGLQERAFVGEAEAFCGFAGGFVEVVAFPLVPAISEFVEDVSHEETALR